MVIILISKLILFTIENMEETNFMSATEGVTVTKSPELKQSQNKQDKN